jgi:hypothetical protein
MCEWTTAAINLMPTIMLAQKRRGASLLSAI